MNEDIKNRWVERLRSGLPQAVMALNRVDEDHNPKGYCCLGVLCEIAAEEGIVEKVYPRSGGDVMYVSASDSEDSNIEFLPRAVQLWAGLNGVNPTINVKDSHHKMVVTSYLDDFNSVPFSVLNDGARLTFNEIADLIEEKM